MSNRTRTVESGVQQEHKALGVGDGRHHDGGTIVHVGLQDGAEGLDTRRLTLAEIAFLGSYTYAPGDLRAALDTLTRGALGPLDWLERRSLADGARAFEDIDTGSAPPKIVLLPEPRS